MVLQFAVVDLGTLGLVNLWQWSRIIRVKIQKGHWPPTTSCFIAGKWSIYPPHVFTALMNFKRHLMWVKRPTHVFPFRVISYLIHSPDQWLRAEKLLSSSVVEQEKARRNQCICPLSGDSVPFVSLMAIVVSTFYLHSWNSKHWQ